MKKFLLLFLVLFFFVLTFSINGFAQQRILVSPNQEIIPLHNGEGAIHEIMKGMSKSDLKISSICPGAFPFGFAPDQFPPNTQFTAGNGDVIGQWYVAAAPGTIDTIFWCMGGSIESYDSIVNVSVHVSTIGPDYGPGIRPGPFNPPCVPWGYWRSTNDSISGLGISPFIELATDTEWISTYIPSSVGSRPPVGAELWSWPIHVRPGINYAVMRDLQELKVTKGQKFFISLSPSPAPYGIILCPDWPCMTLFTGYAFTAVPGNKFYPSRDWKFYLRPKGPTACWGIPPDSIKEGWVARGSEGDSTSVFVFNIWYVQHITGNVPPRIEDIHPYITTTDDQKFDFAVVDCNPAHPESTGVASVVAKWSVNGTSRPDIPGTNIGGEMWEVIIPGQLEGSEVRFKIIACDLQGDCREGDWVEYTVAGLRTPWFLADTGSVCTGKSIRTTGRTIDTAELFSPGHHIGDSTAINDGTAGPFDIGGVMRIFGENVRYAWIGVNGAIALTAAASDTQHLNSNGVFNNYMLPGQTKTGTADTDGSHIPRNFIAPLWSNWSLRSQSTGCSRILEGNAGDSCLYVVEWDSIGRYGSPAPPCSGTTFRVVLNRCEGTVEFQYDNLEGLTPGDEFLVGVNGTFDTAAHANTGWLLVNWNGHPVETKPAGTRCIRMYPTSGTPAEEGWNLISLATVPFLGKYSRAFLYPDAVSQAFQYQGSGYSVTDPLSLGEGYWLKFNAAQVVGGPGTSVSALDIPVKAKWNLIGSASFPLSPDSITSTPPGIIGSPFFGYSRSSGYTDAAEIQPGRGYWVRCDSSGILHLRASFSAIERHKISAASPAMNRITIHDAAGRGQTLYFGEPHALPVSRYELPPLSPGGFDARFRSQRIIEILPSSPDPDKRYEYPIDIKTDSYPIDIRWEVTAGADRAYFLSDGMDGALIGNTPLGRTGILRIENRKVSSIILVLGKTAGMPKEFSLGQNYPNPFNPVTRFEYALPADARVSLKVFNVLGEVVSTLMDERQSAGYKSVDFDGSSLPSGVYFYRLKAGRFIAVKKMLLIR